MEIVNKQAERQYVNRNGEVKTYVVNYKYNRIKETKGRMRVKINNETEEQIIEDMKNNKTNYYICKKYKIPQSAAARLRNSLLRDQANL